jgi:hypothetical protein
VARITALQLSHRVVEKTIIAERVCAAAGEQRGDIHVLKPRRNRCSQRKHGTGLGLR